MQRSPLSAIYEIPNEEEIRKENSYVKEMETFGFCRVDTGGRNECHEQRPKYIYIYILT